MPTTLVAIALIIVVAQLLGAFLPALEDHLFATAVRGQLNLLGQLGYKPAKEAS